jgi:hypothetical protein
VVERHAVDLLQAVQRVAARVQRQGRRVLRETVPVGEGGVFFLDVTAVRQQDGAQVPRAGGGMHPAPEALARQQWQVAAVVEVGVRQDDGVDLAGHHRQWCQLRRRSCL